MTTLSLRKQQLEEFIKAREAASHGKWRVGYPDKSGRYDEEEQSFCLTKSHMSLFSAKYSENEFDSYFICLAANQSAQMAEDLLCALEALDKIIDNEGTDEYIDCVFICKTALAKIASCK